MAPPAPRKLWNKWREKELLDLDIQGIYAKLSDDDYRVIVDELAFGADTHAAWQPDRLVMTKTVPLSDCVALIVSCG